MRLKAGVKQKQIVRRRTKCGRRAGGAELDHEANKVERSGGGDDETEDSSKQ